MLTTEHKTCLHHFAGSDENSEPQPIPSLLVGCDKDSANVSPYALRYWVGTCSLGECGTDTYL